VDFGVEAYAAQVALQADGKIVAVGGTKTSSTPDGDDWAIARLNANGTLDTGFGNNGKIIMDWGGQYDEAFSVLVQPDGKIVIAGDVTIDGNQNAAIIRLNANGSLDSGFGNGGKVIQDFYTKPHNQYRTSDTFRQIRLDASGRIVAAGTASSAAGEHFAVARYNANGTLDSSFGNGGIVVTNASTGFGDEYSSSLQAMTLQSTGKILLAGTMSFFSGNSDSNFGV
jgi:uncharacterized delta-60 repeat protein